MIPDAALGIPSGFDPNTFRTAIRFAMQMGAPNAVERQVSFFKPTSTAPRYFLDGTEVFAQPQGNIRLDRDGKPLNTAVRVQVGQPTQIQVDVAIETTTVPADEKPVGPLRPLRATVTVLDEDYVKIEHCREMTYNGDRYRYQDENVYGLFGVDVHSINFFAIDEG